MKLYNTLTRQVGEFKPVEDKKVGIYSCGPTVYDHIHIGNLSAFIVADTLRRALTLAGYEAKHVMNFTDVDDKTIRRSQEKYPDIEPKVALLKLTDDYSKIFMDDMQAVGNDVEALTFIKATDSIPAMQKLITELVQKDFAYIADDGVYFSITKYQASGKTYGQLTDITASSTSEARIQNDEYDKESAHDFALWKKQKDGEPAWDFEIDGQDLKGRPGWHIECSAMSKAELGQPFDIHTGGVDLIFPHHENEIAQSTAGHDDPALANFFVHNEHILIDGKKMSKSLNNFYTLKDITNKGFDPLAFRLLVLQSHYRNQAHFSWENLKAAQNRLQEYRRVADLQYQPAQVEGVLTSPSNTGWDKIFSALTNDLNSPEALATLSMSMELIKLNRPSIEQIDLFKDFLQNIDSLLGLDLNQTKDITNEQKGIITEHWKAREKKDYITSDELRKQLEEQGISVRDTDRGPIWFRL